MVRRISASVSLNHPAKDSGRKSERSEQAGNPAGSLPPPGKSKILRQNLEGADDETECSQPTYKISMIPAPTPPDEKDRLTALRNLDVLDTQREPEFDALVHAASCVAGVPISLISLVDQDRQWFKANVGLEGVTETDRESAFCSHAILQDAPCLVPDATRDERFQHNPLVTGRPASDSTAASLSS